MAENITLASALKEHQAGNLKEADSLYRQVLAEDPANSEALHNLATIGGLAGNMGAALQLLERAIRIDPENPKYWESMGNACMSVSELEKALQAFQKSFSLGNRNPELLRSFGVALLQAGQPVDAARLLDEARKFLPGDAMLLHQLGNANAAQHRWKRAIAAFEAATVADPNFADAQTSLGFAQLHRADPNPMAAVAPLEAGFRIKREQRPADPKLPTYNATSLPKLRHDVEQFEYLDAIGELPESLKGAKEAYQSVISEIDWAAQKDFMVQMSAEQIERIRTWYNRAAHVIQSPQLVGPAVNPDIDGAAISRSYREEAPGISFFDGLLTDEALAALRKFCLESTIWYDFSHFGGYVGAYMDEGFFSPLLVQIAEELRSTFPEVIGDHRLRQLWAYKYDSALSGISTHADFAAVNVNFWITPDEANLDPDTGGLIVYKAEAPDDWDFEQYNNQPQKIKAFLEAADKGSIDVPYRENRAIMFHSDLFHETGSIRFKGGYENRRINITMLFGDRTHV